MPPGLTLQNTGVIDGTPTAAGTYTATLSASNDAPPDATLPVTVNGAPAPLTVTVDSTTRLVGTTNPTFTVSYQGFVLGDTPAA